MNVRFLDKLTEKQTEILKDFWKEIEKNLRGENKTTEPIDEEELSLAMAYDNPDIVLLRWLRAKKWNVDAAIQKLLETIKWRHEWGVREFLEHGESDIQQEDIQSGKSYFLGRDKQGRPVNYVSVRDHIKDQFPPESTEKLTVYTMEIGRKILKEPHESVTVVFDMTGFGLKNMDYHHLKFLINLLENYYPESFATGLIINAPWIFNGCWYIIRPWLDPVVESKIHFINNFADITQFIDADMLPKRLNGNLPDFKYIPPSEADLEMQRVIRTDTEGKARAKQARQEAVQKYLDITRRWVYEDETPEIIEQRAQATKVLRDSFEQLVPYVHTKTHYHRTGDIDEPIFDIVYQRIISQ